MTTKERVLKILKENHPEAISGEQIATGLGISRAAVWKAIDALRSGGFTINSKRSLGYTLESESTMLSSEDISLILSEDIQQRIHLKVYPTVDSTNQEAKRLLTEGAQDLTIILSSHQSAGKGRLGRTFHSPSHSGLYMSLIVTRELEMSDAILVTSATAVAARRAVEEISGKDIGIKWVNDLYVGDKKVAGILTEGVSSFESGKMESMIIGIGINLFPPEGGFPEEIANIATTLFEEETPLVNPLAAKLISNLINVLDDLHDPAIMADYREHSIVLGRKVKVIQGTSTYTGTVKQIHNNGSLSVTDEEGTEHILNSGEISLRFE